MFLQLFAPLVFMIFDNPSNRKLVFHRSHGITFNTFCACFFDFISSVIFDMIFSTFEAILVSILSQKRQKNSSWKSLFFGCEKKAANTVVYIFWCFWDAFVGTFCSTLGCPFSSFSMGGGGKRSGTGWFPFGAILVSFLCVFYCFFECNLNLFDPGLILETKARKQKKRCNSV